MECGLIRVQMDKLEQEGGEYEVSANIVCGTECGMDIGSFKEAIQTAGRMSMDEGYVKWFKIEDNPEA
jgi:hypothetical protein